LIDDDDAEAKESSKGKGGAQKRKRPESATRSGARGARETEDEEGLSGVGKTKGVKE